MPAVLNASALADYLLATPRSASVAALASQHEGNLHLPHLCDYAVTSVIRNWVLRDELRPLRAHEALADHRLAQAARSIGTITVHTA